MNPDFPLSLEEEEATGAIGGFERAAAKADVILRAHGFHRGLFTRSDRE